MRYVSFVLAPCANQCYPKRSLTIHLCATTRSYRGSGSMHGMEPGDHVFTLKRWNGELKMSLVNASTALDRLCRAIVKVKQSYPSGPVARRLRELALTASVFDPALYAYACLLRSHAAGAQTNGTSAPQNSPLVSAVVAPSPKPQRSLHVGGATRRAPSQSPRMTGQRAYSDSLPTLELTPGARPGGADLAIAAEPSPADGKGGDSKAEMSHSSSKSPQAVLAPTGALRPNESILSSSPNSPNSPPDAGWQLRSGGVVSLLDLLGATLAQTTRAVHRLQKVSSFRQYITDQRSMSVLAVVALLYGRAWRYARWLLSLLATHVLGGRGWVPGIPGIRLLKYALVPGVSFALYRRAQHGVLRRLEAAHARLHTLLRLWHVVMSNVGQKPASRAPTASLAMRMLRSVPPSLNAAFWYRSNDRLYFLKKCLDAAYATIDVWYRYFSASWLATPLMSTVAMYYIVYPDRAAYRASALLSVPDILLVRKIWEVLDDRIMTWIIWALLRRKPVHIKSIRMRQQRLQRGAGPGGSAALGSTDPSMGVRLNMSGSDVSLGDGRSRDAKTANGDDPLAADRLEWSQCVLPRESVEGGVAHSPSRASIGSMGSDVEIGTDDAVGAARAAGGALRFWLASADSLDFMRREGKPIPVVIYLHGGGFVSKFPSMERQMVARWADDTRALCVYVDYSLAPEARYPRPLDECFAVYRCVVGGGLGVVASRVVLVGESNGGTLAAAVCVRAAQEGVRAPDGLVLGYPVLSMVADPTTPSRALFMSDPVVPMNLINGCSNAYLQGVNTSIQATSKATSRVTSSRSRRRKDARDKATTPPARADDPCVSPLLASTSTLAAFPPTDIMVGTFDPFLDDSVRFAQRLTAAGVRVRLRRFRGAPHAIWCFRPALTQAMEGIDLATEWILSHIHGGGLVTQEGTRPQRDTGKGVGGERLLQ